MARSKINYTEPFTKGNDLEIGEFVSGSVLKDKDQLKTILTNRYHKSIDFNPLDMYQITGGEVSFNVKSTAPQLGFMPEYSDDSKADFLRLTFTPNIKELKYIGKFDFYSGDRFGAKELSDFPFALLINMQRRSICGYNGTFDALAIGGNSKGDTINKEIGKNYYNFDKLNGLSWEEDDGFYVIMLGKNLNHIGNFKFEKAKYPLYKMSFMYGDMFLINYDYHKKKLLIRKNDTTLFRTDLESGETLKFFRTYKIDLIYSNKRFILLEKINSKVTHKEQSENFNNLSFNPVLKTICLEKDDYYKVYKFYKNDMFLIHDKQRLNPLISKYAVQWAGNLEFDYMIRDTFNKPKLSEYVKKMGYRGHYLREFGEWEADFELGLFQKQIRLGMGVVDDFHINNTDDADMGVDEYLSNRRKITPHEKINLARISYVRMFKTARQIVFYSADFDNNFGELHLFSY